ncbi:MAG TPA: protein translocase subunit SecD [Candidatus Eisenbacteria bacterium]|nr:protein translocase subunit SecD [Candidatus Eisenbacteria bacterium]
MNRSDLWKLVAVLAATTLSLVVLYPSLRFYQLPTTERLEAPKDSPVAKLRQKAIALGLDLQGGLHLELEVDRTGMTDDQAARAVDRAITVIRGRIDQFGVAEPLIQKQGLDRIVVQLPGVTDVQRAKELIGKTAQLEFKLVVTPEEGQQIFERIDNTLAQRVKTGQVKVDTALAAKPLTSHFLEAAGAEGFVMSEDVPTVKTMLAQVDSLVPGDVQLAWGPEDEASGRRGQWLYALRREAALEGESVASAQQQISQQHPGSWEVALKLTPRAATRFTQVTGANVGRQLAIVLDGVVNSAPSIRERIPSGNASIEGRFTSDQAKDLAVVLEAGALPAPVHVIQEQVVGASLGTDSIKAGWKAAWVGTLAVILFMLVYYQLSGGLAVAALMLNVLYLLACLVGVHATLTLPGIAGIVLTIGMSVDANVLILERIREELRNGRSIRTAIQMGYDRAFRTILDAHVTTLISAAFLFQFGTGPIRGFAVTLSLGLIANMFTAVLFTRLVYDLIQHKRTLSRLSI